MNIPLLSRLREFAGITLAESTVGRQEQQAAELVKSIRAALPELLAVAVIHIESGQALAVYSSDSSLKPAKVAAHNAEVIKLKRQALRALGLQQERIEDVLITLRQQLHLLRVSADEKTLLYLIVGSRDTNLAIARTVLRDHS